MLRNFYISQSLQSFQKEKGFKGRKGDLYAITCKRMVASHLNMMGVLAISLYIKGSKMVNPLKAPVEDPLFISFHGCSLVTAFGLNQIECMCVDTLSDYLEYKLDEVRGCFIS